MYKERSDTEGIYDRIFCAANEPHACAMELCQ